MFSKLSLSIALIMLLLFSSCWSKKLPKAKKITLYNTMIYDFKGINYSSLDTISVVIKKEITDEESLQSFNSAIKIADSYLIWKGYIMGKVEFDNGQVTWVKISRYGAFFREVQSNTFYKIDDKVEREVWENFIDKFLATN